VAREAAETDRIWTAKIARYLAYCVDGGLLQSKFTIQTMIEFAARVTDTDDEQTIQREIAYLLHLRDKDQAWTYKKLGDVLKDINPQQQLYN